MAAWELVSAEPNENEQPDLDAPRENRPRCVYPRPDNHASAWATMLRDEDLLHHTPRIARLFGQLELRVQYILVTAEDIHAEYQNIICSYYKYSITVMPLHSGLTLEI